jgi:cell envelope opacity-associated protein A
METIRLQNELVPALGNMRVNARGDQLGSGGKIIKTREMIMDEFYKTRATPTENIPQQGSIPTRSNPTRRKSDPLPMSSKKSEFTPDDARPDIVEAEPVKTKTKKSKAKSTETKPKSTETKTETKLKGGLAAAIAKTQSTEKKVKRID